MAKELKCWKKTSEKEDLIQHKKEFGNFLVTIRKASKGMKGNSVEIGKIGTSGQIFKRFKNKQQALKFAKSYMRKHDKC